MNPKSRPHISVMEKEMIHFFSDRQIDVFFEGTLGAGGHAKALLEAHPEIRSYFGCDQDPEALEIAKATLDPWKGKVVFVRGNFSDLDKYLAEKSVREVDGFFLIWGYHLCN